MKNRLVTTLLTSALILSVAAVPLVSAKNNASDFSKTSVNVPNVQSSDGTYSIVNEQPPEVTPMATYVAVNETLNSKTGSQSVCFDTSKTYGWYRIWVSNTSKVKYKILIKDDNGNNQGEFEVSAGGTNTIRNNNAATGRRYVSITSTDGSALSGTISVRLAEEKSELAD